MKKNTFKEIFTKTIIIFVIMLAAISGIIGCHGNLESYEANSKDMASAAEKAEDGSNREESGAERSLTGNEQNFSDESESNNQANAVDGAAVKSAGSNEGGTTPGSENSGVSSDENGGASKPTDNSESITTTDENIILFTFVISGDNRPENNDAPQPEVFIKLLKNMKQQNPAFYIQTGDIIMGNTENENVIKRQFSDYLDALTNLGALNFVAPGNHDVANNTSRKYFSGWIQKAAFDNAGSSGIKINPRLPENELSGSYSVETAAGGAQIENGSVKNSFYYYFEYKGLYFVILNAYEKGYWGFVQGDQLFWLEQLLDKLKDKPVFVFLHPPPYSVINPDCITDGSLHIAFSSKENQDYIRALFARFKVDGVFNGHEHLYDMQEHDGVKYIITGGSGSLLYAPKDKGGFYHFIKIRVKPKSWIMDVTDSSGSIVFTEEKLFN